MNKEDLEKLQQKYNELTETSKKYKDLGYEKTNKINYRKPENEQEKEFIKRVNHKMFLFLLCITILLLIVFILCFIAGSKIVGKILMGIMVLLSEYFTYKTISTDELMIGKAVYKERKRNTSSKRRSYNYYVSVLDEENKLVYTKIQISKREYDIVEEGTPILISKGANRGYIYD